MAKKNLEIDLHGIGDISSITRDQNVSDLRWLNIDVDEYKKYEALPKQNLDIIPELHSSLMNEDKESVPSLVPLKPHVIVNQNPLDDSNPAPIRSTTSIINRLSSYILAKLPDQEIEKKLRLEFSPQQLKLVSPIATKLVEEKHLIGNVYIDSNHYPKCATSVPLQKFVNKYAKRALYVLAKDQCADCVCNHQGTCSAFKKKIVASVPYNNQTLANYVQDFINQKRISSEELKPFPVSPESIKNILKIGFSRSPVLYKEPIQTIQTFKQTKITPTEAQMDEFINRRLAKPVSMPDPMYLIAAKQLMLNQSTTSIFSSSSSVIKSLSNEYGLIGYTYLDADALGGCRQTVSHIRSRNLKPDFVILRSMASEIDDTAFNELRQTTKIVVEKPVITKDHFLASIERAIITNRISIDQASVITNNIKDDMNWSKLTAEMNLYIPTIDKPVQKYSSTTFKRHIESKTIETADPDKIYYDISNFMNSGKSGRSLQSAILSTYTVNDLKPFRQMISNFDQLDGIQGNFFIDPTIYADYGKGCLIGSKSFKKNHVNNIMAGTSCMGCTSQIKPGWCSRYQKTLIRSIPDQVITAAKEQRKLPVIQPTVGTNPVQDFGLKNHEIMIDPIQKKPEINIKISSKLIK